MQVIIFSWEYPPRIVGQLADYVEQLAVQLFKSNEKTWVVTYHDFLTGEYEGTGGVKVVRVTNPVRTHIGVLTWVLTLNQEVERVAANIYYGVGKQIDLIDVHEWHFIPAAVTLKKALDIPYVYSVESLEEHRSHGANSPFNMSIESIERLGTHEAGKVLTKSEWMRDEIIRSHKVPEDRIRVVLPTSASWLKEILETYKNVAEGRTQK